MATIRVREWLLLQDKLFRQKPGRKPLQKLCDSANVAPMLRIAGISTGCVQGDRVIVRVGPSTKKVSLAAIPGSRVYAASLGTRHNMLAHKVPIAQEEELTHMFKVNRAVLCSGFPHFPIVYGAVRCEQERYYLAFTERFNGTLANWLNASKARSWREISEVLVQVLLALAMLHGMGLTHGALTPENIVFLRTGYGTGSRRAYRIGGRDIFVRKMEHVWALTNLGKSRPFRNAKVRSAPHCEVRAVLKLFSTRFKSSSVFRRRFEVFDNVLRSQRPDAAMFLHNLQALMAMQSEAVMVATSEQEHSAMLQAVRPENRFDVLPATYKARRGTGTCGTGINSSMRSLQTSMGSVVQGLDRGIFGFWRDRASS